MGFENPTGNMNVSGISYLSTFNKVISIEYQEFILDEPKSLIQRLISVVAEKFF